MSWTITEDNGVLHVRAALDRAEEALDLIERLRERYATFEFKEGKRDAVVDGTTKTSEGLDGKA